MLPGYKPHIYQSEIELIVSIASRSRLMDMHRKIIPESTLPIKQKFQFSLF
ncbi:Uncharacterised protein [Legionella cincinnatiensis]|uniref:Uncharacterized protein n=1 Tax=Legionella cincinnatiensis TaxID=28085 RepID=A0A378IFC1_9GAMM|nr:hypothetical protein Lcin_1039 [Legionella cincinnatiensis]STX33435.1 Uncharacterised protein [Legionella cincinnatiensis]